VGSGNNSSNNNNNNGGGNENISIRNTKAEFLHNVLVYNNLGVDYFNLLYECVGILPHPNNPNSYADVIISSNCIESKLPCLNEATNFINEYNLDVSYNELEILVGGFGNFCTNQDDFDEFAVTSIISNSTEWPNPFAYKLAWDYFKKKWKNRNSPYNQANSCEKELMLSNPYCASQLGLNWISANLITKVEMGINSQNDCSDAFRHTLFNALNASFCGVQLAKEFGNAHECVTTSQKAKIMDLQNNEIGYTIIEENQNLIQMMHSNSTPLQHQALNQLVNLICTKLANGEMIVFSIPNDPLPDNNPNNNLVPSIGCSCIN
jgi:hypothetical protein